MAAVSKSAIALVMVAGAVRAEPAPTSLDLDGAIAFATAHHPALRADAADVRAATEQVDVERAKYTPDLELFAQLDRATQNAVPGPFFAVPGLPVVAGTPGRTFDSGHWGSEVGASATWDALGYRKWDAMIDKARAEVQLARDSATASALDVQYLAADRFIAAVERDQALAAAKAGVDRAQVFLGIVQATVGSDLRAGADLSRAKAELAFAKTQLARAQAALAVSQSELREALGAPDAPVQLEPGKLAATPPAALAAAAQRDPRLVAADDRVHVAEAERRVIATGTQPKLALVGALFARGNGTLTGGADAHGIVPDAPNWALGVLLTWPVLADRSIAPAVRAQQARIAAERAHEDVLGQQLASRNQRAKALLDGALEVARNTPDALTAAQDAEKQTVARFKAQLATADDVAQVERLLVQAETDDALARLDVWRAVLFVAYANGDLAPFLAQYRGAVK
ncbi:MAG: TolC family protein [Acidobacteriota bacterium]